jgi:hypothetical protein
MRIIHGHARKRNQSAEYICWCAMIRRCENRNNQDYKEYGGAGISVCERWRKSFVYFLSDMGEKPSQKHSLDRFPNQKGNYEPGNCRWATPKQQALNRKSSKLLTFRGKTQTITEWEGELGFTKETVQQRIRVLKWTVEKALTTPQRIYPKRSNGLLQSR